MNHLFKVALNWIKKEPQTDSSTRIYTKSHYISIEGKPDLEVSAAKTFKGDPNLYNPEDLLLISSQLKTATTNTKVELSNINKSLQKASIDGPDAVLKTAEINTGCCF